MGRSMDVHGSGNNYDPVLEIDIVPTRKYSPGSGSHGRSSDDEVRHLVCRNIEIQIRKTIETWTSANRSSHNGPQTLHVSERKYFVQLADHTLVLV